VSKTIRTSCYLTVVGHKDNYQVWELRPGRLAKRTSELPACAANEVPILKNRLNQQAIAALQGESDGTSFKVLHH